MRISDWSSDVCSSDLRLSHLTGKLFGLVRAKDGAHREDMGEGLFLKLTHSPVRTIYFGRDSGTVAMFGLNRGCETSVVGAQFELEGALLDCELPLHLFDLGELLFVEAQFLMQGLVEGTGFLGGMLRNDASYENAGERRHSGRAACRERGCQ